MTFFALTGKSRHDIAQQACLLPAIAGEKKWNGSVRRTTASRAIPPAPTVVRCARLLRVPSLLSHVTQNRKWRC